MNKRMVAILGIAVAVVALAAVGVVRAQTPISPTPGTNNGVGGWMGGMMNGWQSGRGSGRGMMGGWSAATPRATADASSGYGTGMGQMHELMTAVIAEKLGLTEQELDDRLAKGETMAQIAQENGLTSEQFSQMMLDARDQALDQAVQQGIFTAERAQWMKDHMRQMSQYGFGPGRCMGGGWAPAPTKAPGL